MSAGYLYVKQRSNTDPTNSVPRQHLSRMAYLIALKVRGECTYRTLLEVLSLVAEIGPIQGFLRIATILSYVEYSTVI